MECTKRTKEQAREDWQQISRHISMLSKPEKASELDMAAAQCAATMEAGSGKSALSYLRRKKAATLLLAVALATGTAASANGSAPVPPMPACQCCE
jgi:hypothetical protein